MEDYKEKWLNVRNLFDEENIELGHYFFEQIQTGHIVYTLSRYKFASRLIEGKRKLSTIELGCNEGLGTLQLARVSDKTLGIDFDKKGIDWAKSNIENGKLGKDHNVEFVCDDFIGKIYGEFDAVVSLDVIEHIPTEIENKVVETFCNNLKHNGFCLIGTPNINSSVYSSKTSLEGHINLYSADRLQELLLKSFSNVFIFGGNDEMIHTGFRPMTHYLLALCCNKITK